MARKLMSIALIGLLCLAPEASGLAAELKGVTMPDQVNVQGHTLVLNGLGLRKAYAVVSVYVAGLYLEKQNHNADEIIRSGGPKRLVLHFLMDVDQGKIRAAWSEGFAKNCSTDCRSFDEPIKTLNGWMTDMRTGQELGFIVSDDSVTVDVNGAEKGTIRKEGFPQQFLTIFLGRNPPNKGLKDGLLGSEK